MITIESVTRTYGSFTAVDDVSFTARPGRVTGFLGPNGAGKSTTMRIIVGLTRPVSGTATISGRRYVDLPNPGLEVGVLLDASAQHAGRTGREILTIAQCFMGLPRQRVEEMLGLVSLTVGRRRAVHGRRGLRPWRDRLRLERAVWAFDRRLQDPPRKSRVARRRELRDNLRSATEHVGAAEAVRQLGDLRQLAAGYLPAEYGDWQPRPSWTRAAAGAVLFYLLLTWLLEAGSSAFSAGILTGQPGASGSFTWNGIPYLLDDVAFTFSNGASTSVGGAWRPLAYVGLLLVSILAGRLWRLLPGLAPARQVTD